MIRKTIFWIHLSCGVASGLVILMMSVTGVILTYERQMLDWADQDLFARPGPEAVELPIEALITAVRLERPDFAASSIAIRNDPAAPARIAAGRGGAVLVDRYTGEVLGAGPAALEEFFGAITGWHRWFNADGQSRRVWRTITGASNLAFLFLILSGLYLWLPRLLKWPMLKARLLLNLKPPSGRARDFNWHHVFGIWSALPLMVVVATATVFSYGWANDLLYRSFGEAPPVSGARGQPAPPIAGGSGDADRIAHSSVDAPEGPSFDELFGVAARYVERWQEITMRIPVESAMRPAVSFTIDQGNGGQPQLRHSLTLDRYTGKVVSWEPFESQSPARRARSWVRFLHTGEALGLIGQTVAGLVSAASLIMVWTGLALAYRRLIAPLIRRTRRSRAA